MIHLLAVDTASEACSAALQVGPEIRERCERTQRGHGPKLLTMIDELLAESGLKLTDLDAIAFGCGPGSFTGLRISAGITQGLALAADLPVLPVSDLAMQAQAVMDDRGAEAVAVCLDARMNEAFVGFFARGNTGLARSLLDEALLKPDSITLPEIAGPWFATGTGWGVFAGLAEQLGVSVEPAEIDRLPSARSALRLAEPMLVAGEASAPEFALPVYLREKVAWKKQST